ncbi:hypothetical protein PROFUN_04134 [Planoprotostelium fungivorum]|uniref:Small ribosomal subunit protein uS15 N-terminal domain-containing protein n=1 Tax=Planoprotostelium fungivorum TaxID=1890364 RepID=A0A2P6NJJ5_9EUKA|nr:hypothetical protein PROFUN_04134 [Planoprotostelium fungivorum]
MKGNKIDYILDDASSDVMHELVRKFMEYPRSYHESLVRETYTTTWPTMPAHTPTHTHTHTHTPSTPPEMLTAEMQLQSQVRPKEPSKFVCIPSSPTTEESQDELSDNPSNAHVQRWMANFEKLKRFKKMYGTTSVTRSKGDSKSLGNWVHEQRRKHRNGTLLPFQRQMLDSINFGWVQVPLLEEMERLSVRRKFLHDTTTSVGLRWDDSVSLRKSQLDRRDLQCLDTIFPLFHGSRVVAKIYKWGGGRELKGWEGEIETAPQAFWKESCKKGPFQQYLKSNKMGRMHSGGKGISGSALPYKRTPPSWLKTTPSEVAEHVMKLSKKGLTPSQIGVVLRDSHGIAQVKNVTGTKILRILRYNGIAPEIPEDLYHLIKKAVAVRKHLEKNRKDKDAKFRLILVESRVHRLARYYKTYKVLPPTWKYESGSASALVS